MKTQWTIVLSISAGVAVGAAAVQVLHAQAEPPVANVEPFDKEYVPPAARAVTNGGGKYIVRGGEVAAFYGDPPNPRIAIMVFANMEKAKAAFNSQAYKDAKRVGDKYAKFRIYAVEGLSQ